MVLKSTKMFEEHKKELEGLDLKRYRARSISACGVKTRIAGFSQISNMPRATGIQK